MVCSVCVFFLCRQLEFITVKAICCTIKRPKNKLHEMEMSQGRQKTSLSVAQCLLYGIHCNDRRITYRMSEL